MSRRVEFFELALLLCAVALFYFVVIPAGIIDPDGFVLDEGLPPSFSARLVAVLAALVLIARVISLLWFSDASTGSSIEPATDDLSDEAQPVRLSLRVWTGVAVSLLFAFGLVPILGFGAASLITLALMLFVLGERSTIRLALFPVLVSAFVWLLFTQVLSIKLPVGMLLPLITGT